MKAKKCTNIGFIRVQLDLELAKEARKQPRLVSVLHLPDGY